eukprot:Pgem_evm2s16918
MCSIVGFQLINDHHLVRKSGQEYDYLNNCIQLDLSNYSINTIDDNAFVNMTNLTLLNLTLNNISYVSDDLFVDLVSLNDNGDSGLLLDLQTVCSGYLFQVSNGILERNNISFSSPESCEVLNLSHYHVTSFKENCFKEFTQLSAFDISSNNLIDLGSVTNALKPSNLTLKRLTVDNNTISSIIGVESLAFLEKLSLRTNNIIIIEDQSFMGLTSLSYLDLSNNEIAHITNAAFAIPELNFLNLSTNQLSVINEYDFAQITENEILDLSFNEQLSCCPSLKEISNLLNRKIYVTCVIGNETKTSNNINEIQYVCESINAGSLLQEAHDSRAVIIGCVVGGLVLIILIVTGAVIYCMKKKKTDKLFGVSAAEFVMGNDDNYPKDSVTEYEKVNDGINVDRGNNIEDYTYSAFGNDSSYCSCDQIDNATYKTSDLYGNAKVS